MVANIVIRSRFIVRCKFAAVDAVLRIWMVDVLMEGVKLIEHYTFVSVYSQDEDSREEFPTL